MEETKGLLFIQTNQASLELMILVIYTCTQQDEATEEMTLLLKYELSIEETKRKHDKEDQERREERDRKEHLYRRKEVIYTHIHSYTLIYTNIH